MIDSDPTGNPTIGYGHLCSDSACSEVPYPIPLSDTDGDELLRDDLSVSRINWVNHLFATALTDARLR